VADDKKPPIIPKEPYLPFTRDQNPAPIPQAGQQGVRTLRNITDSILRSFQQILPSNYVGEIPGPYYVLQYQAIAEQLASLQLAIEDVGLESDVDFARPEFLWQMIGTLVFPDTLEPPVGIPEVDGDLTYREFLRRMIILILQGATEDVVQEGLELLTEAVVQVIAKVDFSHREISEWDLGDQNEFEINILCQTVFTASNGELIVGALGTGFPIDPFRVLRNNLRILRALKPAKALFEYRHLFLDAFGELFQASPFIELDPWYYEDFRKFCCGMKEITNDEGVTLTGRMLFQDVSLDFRSVCPGATLEILDGPNASSNQGGEDNSTFGRYRVTGLQRLIFGADGETDALGDLVLTPRPYTTSPTGLSGDATADEDGVLEDTSQDFSDAVEGEILTFLEGPNAGQYRLDVLLGNNGGPVGFSPPGSGVTRVQVAPSLLQILTRMPQEATGQSYRVTVERLGVRTPFTVLGEDASAQFYI
jgi:hypothetical protein